MQEPLDAASSDFRLTLMFMCVVILLTVFMACTCAAISSAVRGQSPAARTAAVLVLPRQPGHVSPEGDHPGHDMYL